MKPPVLVSPALGTYRPPQLAAMLESPYASPSHLADAAAGLRFLESLMVAAPYHHGPGWRMVAPGIYEREEVA